ncbi:MAG: hypothetical protein OSB41_00250 [Kiritimatiellae bacterium]|nr:hypothetical protein [Kiritimatiellia bacterium]
MAEDPALPQTTGGRMRIIFGYNEKAKEILYTDSWGAGHERKWMSIEDARTITSDLYVFTTRS